MILFDICGDLHVCVCVCVGLHACVCVYMCVLQYRKVNTSWNWWILSACLLVVEQTSGKVLEQHFLGKVKIFCVFMWGLREEYFTLHGTWDTKNYDLFITWWRRRCGFLPPSCVWKINIFKLSDLCYCSSPCACGVTVIDMYHHQHWQVMESYASFMNPPWCWVWLMIQ